MRTASLRTITTAIAIIAAISSSANAATIVSYPSSPNGATIAANFANPAFGTTANALARGPGLTQGGGATFNSSHWIKADGITQTASAADAVAEGDVLTFGFTTTTPVNLTDMDIRYDRSGTGPPMIEIQLSVNNGPFNLVFADATVTDPGEDNLGIPLNASSVTSAMFRLAGWGAGGSGGTFDIETITGSTVGIEIRGVAIPEPASALMAGLGVLGLALVRRRR